MRRDESEAAVAVLAVASTLGLALLRGAEALAYVVLRLGRGTKSAREVSSAADEIRRVSRGLIADLEPIARAATVDEMHRHAERLEPGRDPGNVTHIRPRRDPA
jgi:hypothetical protein